MMLLAIDTATKWTGLALHNGRTIVAEAGWYSKNNQTVELAPAVDNMLKQSGVVANDLSGIAVAIGPGSYTGLRIGLGFAKGLVLANQTKLIGVPTLDILASAMPRSEGNLVVVAEAGRSRVCSGRYEWAVGKGWESSEEPIITSWDQLIDKAEAPATFAGEISPTSAKMIRSVKKDLKVTSAASSLRRAGYLAEIGWRRLKRGWIDDPGELAPIYLLDPAGAVPQEK